MTLAEVRLGRGDYVAGGACSEPFLEQDGARRRRPMVLGEITLGDVDPLAGSMFSGRASDPGEWAVMWKELGADGVCVRTCGRDDAPDIIHGIEERTALPVAVDGPNDILERCSAIGGTRLLMLGGRQQGHAFALPPSDGGIPEGEDGMFLLRSGFPERAVFEQALDIRRRGLAGEPGFGAPIVFDVTPVWDKGFGDERIAAMTEGEAALAAMLAGADIIITRGPGAADMARVYGEELADL